MILVINSVQVQLISGRKTFLEGNGYLFEQLNPMFLRLDWNTLSLKTGWGVYPQGRLSTV